MVEVEKSKGKLSHKVSLEPAFANDVSLTVMVYCVVSLHTARVTSYWPAVVYTWVTSRPTARLLPSPKSQSQLVCVIVSPVPLKNTVSPKQVGLLVMV